MSFEILEEYKAAVFEAKEIYKKDYYICQNGIVNRLPVNNIYSN